MTKKDFYYPSADGRTTIHAISWEPDEKPVAIVQLIHGMCEFIDRYDDFARFLCDNGFLVVGEDHLGHGESVVSKEYLGFFGKKGNEWMIADIHHLRMLMRQQYPDLKYLMLGHSMGSFLVRQYITEDDARFAEGLSGVVIMGTGWTADPVIRSGMLLARLLGLDKVGKRARLIELASFGSYLKRIPDAKTGAEWLTKDNEIIEKYRNNPLNSFHFTPNAFYHMFSGMKKAHSIKRIKKLPAGLPLLFVSGAEDPVGSWGEGVRKAFMVYTENTDCKVDIKLYDDDRHEILNETDREEVYRDLLDYFRYCLGE